MVDFGGHLFRFIPCLESERGMARGQEDVWVEEMEREKLLTSEARLFLI